MPGHFNRRTGRRIVSRLSIVLNCLGNKGDCLPPNEVVESWKHGDLDRDQTAEEERKLRS